MSFRTVIDQKSSALPRVQGPIEQEERRSEEGVSTAMTENSQSNPVDDFDLGSVLTSDFFDRLDSIYLVDRSEAIEGLTEQATYSRRGANLAQRGLDRIAANPYQEGASKSSLAKIYRDQDSTPSEKYIAKLFEPVAAEQAHGWNAGMLRSAALETLKNQPTGPLGLVVAHTLLEATRKWGLTGRVEKKLNQVLEVQDVVSTLAPNDGSKTFFDRVSDVFTEEATKADRHLAAQVSSEDVLNLDGPGPLSFSYNVGDQEKELNIEISPEIAERLKGFRLLKDHGLLVGPEGDTIRLAGSVVSPWDIRTTDLELGDTSYITTFTKPLYPTGKLLLGAGEQGVIICEQADIDAQEPSLWPELVNPTSQDRSLSSKEAFPRLRQENPPEPDSTVTLGGIHTAEFYGQPSARAELKKVVKQVLGHALESSFHPMTFKLEAFDGDFFYFNGLPAGGLRSKKDNSTTEILVACPDGELQKYAAYHEAAHALFDLLPHDDQIFVAQMAARIPDSPLPKPYSTVPNEFFPTCFEAYAGVGGEESQEWLKEHWPEMDRLFEEWAPDARGAAVQSA